MTGAARLKETLTPKAGERPLLVTGDVVHAVNANLPTATVVVQGKPGHVEGRGLSMQGDAVNLDRGANLVWIDGPGVMTLVSDRDLQGAVSKRAEPLEIEWAGRMQFDGRKATFERAIHCRRGHERLETQTLEVSLSQRVDFANPKQAQRPEVQRVVCREGVYVERHVYDEMGLASIEQMQTADLSINQDTGAIFGSGPGWIKRVGRGGADGGLNLSTPGAPGATARSISAPAEQDEGLRYLSVEFQRAMNGNLKRRQIVFGDQVQTIYGPVSDWRDTIDPDRTEQLGETGVVVNCDQMTLTEMPAAGRKRGWMELEATGNTLVEGQTFTARANRMTYAEAKDLLILEGTQRASAELYRQARIAGPYSNAKARKIQFWRSANRVEVIDAKFADVSQMPTRQPRKTPGTNTPAPPRR